MRASHAPTFYLGTHHPRDLERTSLPLFVSLTRLLAYRRAESMPTSRTRWALDSGAFSELARHGKWCTDPELFGSQVVRVIGRAGRPPDFVAPQDRMCEPWLILGGHHGGQKFHGSEYVRFGLRTAVRIHQDHTVENLTFLRREFPMVPWLPVLQGWSLAEYLRCADQYAAAGVDLTREPLVGLGSVCRRQATAEVADIAAKLAATGIRLHGFGVKRDGLRRHGRHLASADSMAWSVAARRRRLRLPGCTHRARFCNNCLTWAQTWREAVVGDLSRAA
jgi:hypothetical protein